MRIVFNYQHTTERHVKNFLRTRQARENILFLGRASFLGNDYRVVPVYLDREVRRCFKCQKFGHTQHVCSASKLACGKCAGEHRTHECAADKKG
jgi:hypothetical protein